MEPPTVLVVEDDDQIADLLALYLGQAGFAVVRAGDGYGGLRLAAEREPVLVVVDIGLPGGIDGLEVCRRLRADGDVPVLVLTARGDEDDRVTGFAYGADDYVTKPFSPRELVARIQAIVRRSGGAHAGTVAVGDVEVDLARHEVRRAGRAVPLAPASSPCWRRWSNTGATSCPGASCSTWPGATTTSATSARSTSTSASSGASSGPTCRSPPSSAPATGSAERCAAACSSPSSAR